MVGIGRRLGVAARKDAWVTGGCHPKLSDIMHLVHHDACPPSPTAHSALSVHTAPVTERSPTCSRVEFRVLSGMLFTDWKAPSKVKPASTLRGWVGWVGWA